MLTTNLSSTNSNNNVNTTASVSSSFTSGNSDRNNSRHRSLQNIDNISNIINTSIPIEIEIDEDEAHEYYERVKARDISLNVEEHYYEENTKRRDRDSLNYASPILVAQENPDSPPFGAIGGVYTGKKQKNKKTGVYVALGEDEDDDYETHQDDLESSDYYSSEPPSADSSARTLYPAYDTHEEEFSLTKSRRSSVFEGPEPRQCMGAWRTRPMHGWFLSWYFVEIRG
jgi:hypothetical protein